MEERKTNCLAKIHQAIKTYVPPVARVLLCLTLVSAVVHTLARLCTPFADFINRYVAGAVRLVLAKISGILPFSFAETVLIALPLLLVIVIVCAFRMVQNKRSFWRYLSSMLA